MAFHIPSIDKNPLIRRTQEYYVLRNWIFWDITIQRWESFDNDLQVLLKTRIIPEIHRLASSAREEHHHAGAIVQNFIELVDTVITQNLQDEIFFMDRQTRRDISVTDSAIAQFYDAVDAFAQAYNRAEHLQKQTNNQLINLVEVWTRKLRWNLNHGIDPGRQRPLLSERARLIKHSVSGATYDWTRR